MTRIIAGKAAAVRLTVPTQGTRPTSDKVREALFSTLDAAFELADARVLDLYAGSGSLGLEALSRGAESVVLVEKSAAAGRLLRQNADAVAQRTDGTATLAITEVQHWLTRATDEYDLVFCDPPYALSEAQLQNNLQALLPRLSRDGLVVVERSSRTELATPSGYALWREKRYGETTLYYFEPAAR